jgi:uncharacterized delta-60 repeat protein
VRYNADGGLDTSFGSGGIATSEFIGSDVDMSNAVVVQPDGKVIAVGATSGASTSEFALARYNVDGSLDTSFGTGGQIATPFPGFPIASARSVALEPDGKIVVGG